MAVLFHLSMLYKRRFANFRDRPRSGPRAELTDSVRAGEVRCNVCVPAFVFRLLRVRTERSGPDGLAVVVLLGGEQARWRFALLHPILERGERIESKLRD